MSRNCKVHIKALQPYFILIILTLALYWKTGGYEFMPTWDDDEYVLMNPYIRDFSLKNVKEIFSNFFVSNYAPIHILTYNIDYAMGELNPRVYHLSNVLFHTLNVCLLNILIIKLTGSKTTAFLTALLFAVHPVNVENVAWVSERKTLVATFFFFLSLISFFRFEKRGTLIDYSISLFLFALALLSKVSVIGLPLILVAYHLTLKKEAFKWKNPMLLFIIPYFILAALFAYVAFYVHQETNVIQKGAPNLAFLTSIVFPTMLTVIWKYLGLIVLPLNQSGFYSTTLYLSLLEFPVLAAFVGLLLIIILVFWKGGPQVRFWLLWFSICILPVSNIVPLPVYYADRYLYTPAIALFVLFSRAANDLLTKAKNRIEVRNVIFATIFAIILFFAVSASIRSSVWQNDLAFWKDTVEKSPNMFIPHLNLGAAYQSRMLLDEAEQEYLKAMSIYPSEKVEMDIRVLRVLKQMKKEKEGGNE